MHWRATIVMGLTGCASTGIFQTADVLAPGRWEAGADASALLITDASAEGVPVVPMPRAWFRVGLVDRLDLGASIGFDGFRLQPKIQLTRGDGPIVSVSPAVRVLPLPTPGSTVVLTGFEQAVHVGLPLVERRLQPVLTARTAQDFARVDGSTVALVWIGGNLGLSWQVAPAVRLHPEVGLMTPVFVRDQDDDTGFDAAVIQLGIGVGVGRR